jgi:acyl-CoA reductase-like NAD-dependent aldehyde dehydrogenase
VTGEVVAQVAVSGKADVDHAVSVASEAFQKWSALTVKARVQILLKIWGTMNEKPIVEELTTLIMTEHGKNKPEAIAELAKGLETLEYACSMPQLISGRIQEVSRGVYCQERRDPLGVVVSIVPFNFPAMVPFWTGALISTVPLILAKR